MNWSKYQTAIYEAFEHGGDSLLIEAVAGSGKTTVLVELAKIASRAFPHLRIVFLAFNKSICMELNRRLEELGIRNVIAITLHSAGWAAWRRAGGLDWEPRVDSLKVSKIMREALSYEENKRFGETTRKLVSAAKGIGLVPNIMREDERCKAGIDSGLVLDTDAVWEGLMDYYSLAEDECSVPLVRKVLARSIELARESCDFDDMLYMPVIAGVPFDRYDVVLVDEAQDVSGIQMAMIERMVEPRVMNAERRTGRVIAVGDRAQAIYGFRGAGITSMDEMKQRFGMRELPLSVTYRCPVAVVEHAKRWVPQIEAREGAEAGFVGLEGTDWRGQAGVALGSSIEYSQGAMYDTSGISEAQGSSPAGCGATEGTHTGTTLETARTAEQSVSGAVPGSVHQAGLQANIQDSGITKWCGIADFAPGDAILCRLTRPLVAAAFTLIRNRVAGVHVLGRDIGGGLIAIVKKSKMPTNARVSEFDRWLDDYEHREGTRLRNKGKHAQAGLLGDKVNTICVFMEQMSEDATVGELIADIERLFVDANGGTRQMITLATVHKAKGLEWERVFILDASELMPCPWARGRGWEMQQEINCMYIAATRARRELRYIKTGDLR